MLGSIASSAPAPSHSAVPTPDPATRLYRTGVWSLLILAAVLRIVLVFRGGQFTQLDEARYTVSRDAARIIVEGHTRQGLALVFEGGDHVGFKILSLIPALIEATLRSSPRIPACFFAAFSVASLALIGRIARTLVGSRAAEFWAVAAAATCGSLFYFSRHLLPYDTSLAFMLLALHLGLNPSGSRGRSLLAGFAAGCGFVIYYGYWTLGGIVLAMGVLAGCRTSASRSPRAMLTEVVTRAALGFSGLAGALALTVLLDRLFGTGHLISGAGQLAGSILVGDFRGLVAPWEYLWYCDRLLLALFAASTLYVLWIAPRQNRALRAPLKMPSHPQTPEPSVPAHPARFLSTPPFPVWTALAGLLAVQASFIIGADLLHTFAVHDRLIRQLTPFLCLTFGVAASLWLAGLGTRRKPWAWTLGTALALNAVWTLGVPLAQEFPTQFKERGDALLTRLDAQGNAPSSDRYYRYVQVLHYLFEPETLPVEPLRTLLASPHFYTYVPYLFEAKTPEDRAHRRSLDQRMRLVEMPVLPSERILGESYGSVSMQVRFAPGRIASVEPLLSLGPWSGGELFFVHTLSETQVRFGFFSTGYAVFEGDPVTIDRSSPHQITLFSSSLLPHTAASTPASLFPAALARDRAEPAVIVSLDGRRVLEHASLPKAILSQQVYAAVNAIQTYYALSDFSGRIDHVERLPGFPLFGTRHAWAVVPGGSAIELGIDLSGAAINRPEPLVCGGSPGAAVFVFVRRLDAHRARLGIEVWSTGAWESEPVTFKDGGIDRLRCEPGPQVALLWNGRAVLHAPVPAQVGFPALSVDIGYNRIGGSLVVSIFRGRIADWTFAPSSAVH